LKIVDSLNSSKCSAEFRKLKSALVRARDERPLDLTLLESRNRNLRIAFAKYCRCYCQLMAVPTWASELEASADSISEWKIHSGLRARTLSRAVAEVIDVSRCSFLLATTGVGFRCQFRLIVTDEIDGFVLSLSRISFAGGT
jgi:hypothetical protein